MQSSNATDPPAVRHPGCYDLVVDPPDYYAQYGYTPGPTRVPIWLPVKHTMSRTCRQVGGYDPVDGVKVWHDLPECVGCSAPKDMDFINRTRGAL